VRDAVFEERISGGNVSSKRKNHRQAATGR
jgi:hypothetical protein